MKSIKTIGICLLLINVSLVSAQNWTKTVENSGRYIRCQGMFSVEDGFIGYGFIDTANVFYLGGSGGYSPILFSLDSNGDSLKFHEYSVDSTHTFADMTLLPSKECVAIGRSGNSTEIWVIDSLGNLISERNIRRFDYPSIISTPDSGYAIVGTVDSTNSLGAIEVIKFDNNHQMEWVSALGKPKPSSDWRIAYYRLHLAINPLNNHLLIGFTGTSWSTPKYIPGIIELDSAGDTVKVITHENSSWTVSIGLESSGNSIYSLTQESYSTGDSLCLVKLDGQLDTSWFDRTKKGFLIRYAPKSYEGYLVANDSLLYTYDSNGHTNLIWDSTDIGGVLEYSTGSYLSWDHDLDWHRIQIMNFNDPNLEDGYELEEDGFTLFPNPANEFIEVSIDEGRFRLNDIQGRFILEDVFSNHKIDLKEVPRGIYILSIEIGDGSYTTQRLIKL